MKTSSINFSFIKKEDIFSIIPLLQVLDSSISKTVLQSRLKEMIRQGYQCIGIFDEEKLIGACGIWILTKYYVGKHIEPDNIIILPEYQNRNIGTELMHYIDNYAKELGCSASELNSYIKNSQAHKLWEKQGYEVIALHFQKKF